MPIEVVPNRIEVSDISGGYAPDPEESSLPLNMLPDVLNLVLDPGSGAAEIRKGFDRLDSGRINSLSASHYIKHITYYEVISGGQRDRFLVCILSNGTNDEANNVQVWVYDLQEDTFVRVDLEDRIWSNALSPHWSAVVEGTYYGGTRGEAIYSWHPVLGWEENPTTPDVKTWVDSVGDSVDTSTEFGRNFAFKKGQKVQDSSGDFYAALRGVRFKVWETGEKYRKGERVSRRVNHGSSTYFRSFECIQTHTSDATNRPGDGSGTPTDFWKNVRLKAIRDDEDEITADWAYMPIAGKGTVGTYHGFRMWVRHDDEDNWARAQYSAPARPEKDATIADLDFRPTDWAPIDDENGDGGGWFTVPFNKGDAIRAFHSFGNYLIIFGRWQTFVLAGLNEQTWTPRELGKYGTLSQRSVAEMDGLVYFVSPDGHLYMTDGTAIQMVPGAENVREWLKESLDDMMQGEGRVEWFPEMIAYGPYLIISLPDDENPTTPHTLVYEPRAQSFWLWDIPILSMTTGEKGRAQRLWFSTAIDGSATQRPCLFQYTDDPGDEAYVDDDWQAVSATASTNSITWRLRSAWMKFGATRNERRLRRVWALVKGVASAAVTVDTYRNFEEDTARTTAARTLAGTAQGEYAEGKVGTTTLHSVGVRVSGTASGHTSVHGIGVDTEPVRTRFHRDYQ
ncbi:MAG TPA: hypothetical protein VGC81_10950 [Candidatus Methylomirabilis sp.]